MKIIFPKNDFASLPHYFLMKGNSKKFYYFKLVPVDSEANPKKS